MEIDMCQCQTKKSKTLTLSRVNEGAMRIQPYIRQTPLQKNERLCSDFGQNIYLKREDLQVVRSFKVRGAFNKLLSLTQSARSKGVVCASAGNHAQGLAYACRLLNVHCVIFLPKKTPKQKVDQVKYFGDRWVSVRSLGQTFDDSCQLAVNFATKNEREFIHPFDDLDVIAGQGTQALEMISELKQPLDYLFVPVGGGGLLAGLAVVFKELMPSTKIIGVEVEGAAAMALSLANRKITELSFLDSFADGTAVKKVGELTYEIVEQYVDDIFVVSKASVSNTLIDLYNQHGLVTEPSGAMALSAVNQLKDNGLSVACIVSGGNNDASRFTEYYAMLTA